MDSQQENINNPNNELTKEFEKRQKPKNRLVGILLLITILLWVAGIFYFFRQNEKLQVVNKGQEIEIADTYMKLDSVSQELDLKIATIEKLGGDVTELKKIQAELEQDKRNLVLSGKKYRTAINKLEEKVNGYKELLTKKDEEIVQLKDMNEKLVKENNVLKVEKDSLNKEIKHHEEVEEELKSKVQLASQLKATNIKAIAINSRGKEREGVFKNKHAEKVRFSFNIEENKVAPVEGKLIMVRIVDSKGKAIFDVAKGSGSFTYRGRERFYTLKQEIVYDQKNQLVTCDYIKGSDYPSGNYKIEVYADDYLMGKGSFTVK